MDNIRRDLLRGLMAAQQKTLTTIAKDAGTTRGGLSRFMNGGTPSYRTIRLIQEQLNIPPDMAREIFLGALGDDTNAKGEDTWHNSLERNKKPQSAGTRKKG